MSQLRIIIFIGLIVSLTSCSKGPPSGNNVGQAGSGSDGISYQGFRHNSLYAVAAWHAHTKDPVLMILRVDNLPTGMSPVVNKRATNGQDRRPGLKISDHTRDSTWVEIIYDDTSETVMVFGQPRTLQDGRIFLIDTRGPTSLVAQLNGPIPLEIPDDPVDDDTESANVLWTVQEMAERHALLSEFLREHQDTIEYLDFQRQRKQE